MCITRGDWGQSAQISYWAGRRNERSAPQNELQLQPTCRCVDGASSDVAPAEGEGGKSQAYPWCAEEAAGSSAVLQSPVHFCHELGVDDGDPQFPDHLCDVSEHGNTGAAVCAFAGIVSLRIPGGAHGAASLAHALSTAGLHTGCDAAVADKLDVLRRSHFDYLVQLGAVGSAAGGRRSLDVSDIRSIQAGALSVAGGGDGELDAGLIAVAQDSVCDGRHCGNGAVYHPRVADGGAAADAVRVLVEDANEHEKAVYHCLLLSRLSGRGDHLDRKCTNGAGSLPGVPADPAQIFRLADGVSLADVVSFDSVFKLVLAVRKGRFSWAHAVVSLSAAAVISNSSRSTCVDSR